MITESSSRYENLQSMTVRFLLTCINREDASVPRSIKKKLPQIEKVVKAIVKKMKGGGRLFYLGAGTSGRLGILDASEIPPTYGMPFGKVIGLIAGGDKAIRKAVEHAEDDVHQAWKDLKKHKINAKDFVIGIAASGNTPYVIGGVNAAQKNKIETACITCNQGSKLAMAVDYPIEVVVGPEFVTGSTRMKAGTAQKLVLNMISTSVMIQLGRVKGNKMVDMKMTNNKLIHRGTRLVMDELKISETKANFLIKKFGSVRKAVASQRG
ncbi:MAG: N-acetylmuramic acid 6-phosphate etherase [Bacteroidetes bacterium]|nr:N-acetylmuramic acid 6-phosphate etherase [Bacteroidota bacterium]